MVKVIFFDVDGTLISNTNNTIPESTRICLRQLEEKGIRRVLATGRHMTELSLLPVHDIKFDAYLTLNGQLCLDGKGNILSGNPITGASKERIIQIFQEKTLPIVLVEKDRMYINFINEQVRIAQEEISTPVPDVEEYMGNEIYQSIAYLKKGCEKELSDQIPDCKITRWNDNGVDIIAASGGKKAGIQKYLSINGIKENADYITSSVDEDGIKEALEKYNLL